MADVDLAAVKARQQAVWASGDYSTVGSRIQLLSELLCEAVDLRAGERVLDVATGTGNAAIAAARRFCDVVGIDYVPALLEHGRRRAAAEGLPVEFAEGDAEQIPFGEDEFDVVLSVVGAMFAPDQERVAAELLRVCRPGGRIGMVNWTPEGHIGELFRLQAGFIPPPPGVRPAVEWGSPQRLRELFGDAAKLQLSPGENVLRFPSSAFFWEFFVNNYGPTKKAVEALEPARAEELRGGFIEVAERYNRASDGTLALVQEYVTVVATKLP